MSNLLCTLYRHDFDVDYVLERENIDKTKFLTWMNGNKQFNEAKELSYVEFSTKFV